MARNMSNMLFDMSSDRVVSQASGPHVSDKPVHRVSSAAALFLYRLPINDCNVAHSDYCQ